MTPYLKVIKISAFTNKISKIFLEVAEMTLEYGFPRMSCKVIVNFQLNLKNNLKML